MDFLMNLIQLGLDAGILALCCEVVFRQKAEIKAKEFFIFPIFLVICVVTRMDFSIGANMTASFRSEGFEMLPADNIVGLLFLLFAVLLLSSICFGSKSSGTVFCGTMAAFSVFLFVKCLCAVLFAACGVTDILLLLGSRVAALCLIVVLEFTPLFGLIHQLVQRSDFTILIVSTNIALLLMTVLSILSFDVDRLLANLWIIIILILAVLLLDSILLFLHQRRMQEQKRIHMIEQYVPIVEELISQVRARQHEFNNRMMAIEAVVTSADTLEEARKEVTALTGSIGISLNDRELLSCDSKMIAGMLFGKIKQAEAANRHIELSCFSFIDDDGEPIILRFQSYHSYFLKKWIGVGLIAVILTAVQTGAILLSGIGLPLGNEWNLAAGTTEAELFSALEQLFVSPLQAFVCFTLFQLIGSWLIFGICMWIGHFTERKWTIRIVIVLYVLSAVWIKLPAIQNIPLTSFNHLLILHHNFGEPARPWITGFTLLLFMLTIMFSVRFAWRGHLPQLRLKCHGIAAYYSYELMTKRNILILLAVVVGITLYKGLGYGAAESDAEWIYSLFAGHGTGYFQVFPFLEMLITSGVPLYLLAAFVEHTVNGQSIFISVRAKSRRHLVKGILSVSTKFLIIYAFFWLMAGLIGASLFSTGLTIVSFRLMLYAVLMKCLDILAQYLIVLDIYIATRQVTIGFLVLVAGNLLCILPGNWVAYSPFGLSSLTRISVVEPGIGISAVSAFGIEAAILTLMIAGILMWGYKKILN